MTTPETAQDKIGHTLAGKFKLTRLIGSGGMGAVFEAVHTWTERVVAVKILFDELQIALGAAALAERQNDRVKVSDKQARAMSILFALESSLD